MITLRIPAKEPYGYAEIQMEGDMYPEGQLLKAKYDEYIQAFQSENKYSESRFNEMVCAVMASDLTEWQIETDDYQYLTDSQKAVYQEIKKFKKRLPTEEEFINDDTIEDR